jgi:uncharacterized membrane protein
MGVASIAVVAAGMLLGAATYEAVVMAPNYAAQIPQSLEHIRAFFVIGNPGNFFRVLAPATQALLLLAVLLNWRVPGARWWLAGALVAVLLTDVVTFKVHYPRNELLFVRPLDGVPVARLQEAAREWGRWNQVRVGLLAAAAVSALRGLSWSFRTAAPRADTGLPA